MLDNLIQFETPEGVAIEFKAAGPVVRALAWLIDLIIRCFVYFCVFMVLGILSFFSNASEGVWLLFLFFMEWFYPVIFEVKMKGQTPGKKVVGITVIHDNGTHISWRASMLRNFLRVPDFMPTCYAVGFFTMLFSRRFQRLGDLVAGTLVVYRDKDKIGSQLPNTKHPLAPPMVLDLEDQRAVVAFSLRSGTISASRGEELAEILTPLTGKEGNKAEKLQRYAAWLMGVKP